MAKISEVSHLAALLQEYYNPIMELFFALVTFKNLILGIHSTLVYLVHLLKILCGTKWGLFLGRTFKGTFFKYVRSRGEGGVMKMQTEAYRGEGGLVKCIHTQWIRMHCIACVHCQTTHSFTIWIFVKMSWLMSFYFGLPQLATDQSTVAPFPLLLLVNTLLFQAIEAS